jgi:hypothetical protein
MIEALMIEQFPTRLVPTSNTDIRFNALRYKASWLVLWPKYLQTKAFINSESFLTFCSLKFVRIEGLKTAIKNGLTVQDKELQAMLPWLEVLTVILVQFFTNFKDVLDQVFSPRLTCHFKDFKDPLEVF